MKRYLLQMAIASIFGFVKAIAVASIISTAGFGNYATVLGAAMFATMTVSFGLIEATIKVFPRLWQDGARGSIVAETKAIRGKLAFWSFCFVLVAVAMALALGRREWLFHILSIGSLGFLGVIVRLESGQILAIGQSNLIARFSLFRSGFAIAAATAGAFFAGWEGAIVGECGAAIGTIVQARLSLRPHFDGAATQQPAMIRPDLSLYSATLLTSAPAMLDRAAVALAAGSVAAGQFGFALIIAQAGQVLTNIVGQKVGPAIIKQYRQEGGAAPAFRLVMLSVLGCMAASFAAGLVVLSAINLGFGADLAARYELSGLSVVLASALGAAFSFVLVEYAVIALDKERHVLIAAVMSFTVIAAGFALAAQVGANASTYIGVVVAGRATQLIWLVAVVIRGRAPISA